MSTIKAISALLKNPKALKALMSFHSKGYLHSIGWFKAFNKQAAVDQHENPIPWVTYSFIDFIEDRILKTHTIFEYGSGNSTKYYALRAANVTSVEHDKGWYDKVKVSNPANAEIIYSALEEDGAYSKMAVSTNKKYDIIIVDGRDRVNCCKYSIAALSKNGVIVLDDSERPTYMAARKFLIENGFKEISFSGISPGLFYLKSTSVFYKTENCLGI